MIPQGATELITEEAEQQPGQTYLLDPFSGRIAGRIDGIRALKQAVYKIINTERFRHEVYSADYGTEMQMLVGADEGYIRSEFPRRLREALLQDDRIQDVTDFEVTVSSDSATAAFTVMTIYGSFAATATRGNVNV